MIGTYHGARIWCNLDGCGFLCVLATWAMILYSVYVVAFVLLRPTPFEECLTAPKVITSLAFATLAGVAATAHVRTMLTDPGSVPRHATPLPEALPSTHAGVLESGLESGNREGSLGGGERGRGVGEEEEEVETSRLTTAPSSSIDPLSSSGVVLEGGGASVAGGGEGVRARSQVVSLEERRQQELQQQQQQQQQRVVKWCYKCDAFKPPRAHHCSLCQRCIVKMDHHCPWVNNCVGVGNQKLFLLFCAYTSALSLFALLIEGVVILVIGDEGQKEACRLSPGDHVATVALSAMSILFGLFTLCMACDQCQVASTNQTKIDRLKGEVHESVSGANEVFGGTDGQKFRCHWIIPVPARFPAGEAAARIFGYCIGRGTGGGGSGDDDDDGNGTRSLVVSNPGRDGLPADVELAEFGGITPFVFRRPEEEGGGAGGALAGGRALRRPGGASVEERLKAMPERGESSSGSSDGSEGGFR